MIERCEMSGLTIPECSCAHCLRRLIAAHGPTARDEPPALYEESRPDEPALQAAGDQRFS